MKNKKLLIEAISTSSGGSLVHLGNILNYFEKQKYFDEIDVLIPKESMKFLPKKKKINYINNSLLEKNLLFRIFWQIVVLNIFILFSNYKCIFVTGSSHFILSNKVVTISQNLLPFSDKEVKKYFFSFFFLKLKLLKFTQITSFRLSKGIIFLHEYSKKIILKQVGNINAKIKVIAHSVDLRKKIINTTKDKKIRLIYISNIDYYKNQDFVINSIIDLFKKKPKLRKKIFVEFYGNYYNPALKDFNKLISENNKFRKNFKYFGLKSRSQIYKNKKGYTTISLFSSSCENFSVSLIESMAIGVPILCVNLQPMSSVLGNSAFFYKHLSIKNFQTQLIKIINNKKLRKKKSKLALAKSKKYKPEFMAIETYKFLYLMSR